MIIKWETASRMMDAIAFTLCQTVCQEEAFKKLTEEQITDYVNNTTRKIFVCFCEEEGIERVEEP